MNRRELKDRSEGNIDILNNKEEEEEGEEVGTGRREGERGGEERGGRGNMITGRSVKIKKP